jgi:hypothetical protein
MSQTLSAPTQTPNAPVQAKGKPGKVDRVLNAISLGQVSKSKNAPDPKREVTKRLIDIDVASLGAMNQFKYFQFPAAMMLTVDVTLREDAYDRAMKNANFVPDLTRHSKDIAWKGLQPMIATLQDADKHFDEIATKGTDAEKAKMTENLAQALGTINQRIREIGRMTAVEVGNNVEPILRAHAGAKSDYKRYQVKCASNFFTSAVVILGGIGATAASFGAAAPAAIVAITRECVSIGVQIHNMAVDADQVTEEINLEFKALEKLFGKMADIDGSNKIKKLKQSVKEVGLQAISAVLKFPIPSVADCKKRIALLLDKLNGIDVKRGDFGEELAKLQQRTKELSGLATDPNYPAEKRAKIPEKIKSAEDCGKKITGAVEDMRQAIRLGVANHEQFAKNLKIYEDGLSSWTEHAGTVVGFTVDVGLGIASGDSGIERGLNALVAVEQLAVEKMNELMN